MNASDLMTPQPTVVSQRDSIQRAAQLMMQLDVGALPVVDSYESRKLVGMITDRDIVVRHVAMGGSRDCHVSDHMSAHDLHTVHPDTSVNDVLGRMKHDQVRRLPVVDEQGVVIGIIAQADVARRLARRDAHLVGEVLEQVSTPHYLQLQMHV